MADRDNRNRRKLKLILGGLIVIIAAFFFAADRDKPEQPEKISSLLQEGTSLSVDNVHQTATRDGIKEWTLNAASARYMTEKNQAVFQEISVTFFLKGEKEIYLTANQGILKTDSNNIEVRGNVVVENSNYRLKTESLYYEHGKRMFSSKVPVEMTGPAFHMTADSASFDLNSNQTVFQGNVKGVLSENITL
jgi:lipopolysaccharide export system protein LptC